MTTLLILTLVCAVLLALTGSLPPWLGVLISLGCLAGLFGQTRSRLLLQRQIHQQRQSLHAVWGIPVRHLGGLPLPLDTPGNLFLLPQQLLLATERSQLALPLESISQILLTTADQIRKIPDRQLCTLLASASCRTFSALREKIRHRDSALRRRGILMLLYQLADGEPSLLILATGRRPGILTILLNHPFLAGKVPIRQHLGLPDDTVV